MDYNNAIEYIHSANRFGMNLGLDRIRQLLDRLGNPQNSLKFVHIAGTNGKGSVTSFVSNVLKQAGYKVGMYTSPYLVRFNERIRINGEEINDNDLAEAITHVKSVLDKMLDEGYEQPTEFEIVTAVAFYYFDKVNCDFVCLEVGLGGRFDATNVIEKSEVSVITSISKDHMNVLGDSLGKIAFEKAGIIKDSSNVFLYDVGSDEVLESIKNVCDEKKANLNLVSFDDVSVSKSNLANQIFSFESYRSVKHDDVKIRLIGMHQVNNAIMAYNVLEFLREEKGYEISNEDIREGLLTCKWAGRIEVVKESPLIIFDGAHNDDSAMKLALELDRLLDDSYNKILVLGVLADKDVDKIVKILAPRFDKVVVTLPSSDRAMKVEELAYRVGMYCDDIICIENPEEAYTYALEYKFDDESNKNTRNNIKNNKKSKGKKNLNKNTVSKGNDKKRKKAVLVCGSLYLIGSVKACI